MTEEVAIPQDEQGMREFTAPTFDTVEELAVFVQYLTERQHDYGTCVYAMSLAATAAFNHVARKLGVTGFQASCADLDVIRRTRSMKGPFIVLDGENLLYPQYDLRARLEEFITETLRDWAPEQARKLLDVTNTDHAANTVLAHWEKLAAPSSDDQMLRGGER